MNMPENQFGSMPRIVIPKVIHLLAQLMEYVVKKIDVHLVTINIERAFFRVPREIK